MNNLPADELQARFRAITEGPWSEAAKIARQELAPTEPFSYSPLEDEPIALDQHSLSVSNLRKSVRLSRVLRPHFEQIEPIKNVKEIRIRDAFDQALTIPQLYELAVQTGYLPERAVRLPARDFVTELMWSEPARRFVTAYGYVSVPMLANRVGISGFFPTALVEPKPSAALHFAGFLAHLRAFETDEQIQSWVRFLDDYIVEEDEQNLLCKYLQGKSKTQPRRTGKLLSGCRRFVTSLATIFHVLDEDELGRFGLIHSYWLQKFFGYDQDRKGAFVKNKAIWGAIDSWAHTISTTPRLMAAGTDPAIEKIVRQQLVEQVKLLERTFEAVMRLTEETRQAAKVSVKVITPPAKVPQSYSSY
jgi:hypothetical protein